MNVSDDASTGGLRGARRHGHEDQTFKPLLPLIR